MSLDDLQTWKQTFKDQVVPTGGDDWPDNLTDWYVGLFDAPKVSLPGLTIVATPLPVVFGASAFKAIYSNLTSDLSQADAIAIIANAWEAGLLTSTVTVLPGDSIGVPVPTTIWSAVTSTVIDAPSIALGKAKILELIGAPNAKDALDSQTPVKFREATLLLTVTTTGLDSTPTPAGPLALVDAARAVG